MQGKSLGSTLRSAVSDFLEDDALTLAGALAFYSALALSPLLMLFLTVSSFLGEQTQTQMVQRMESVIGPQASQMVGTVLQNAQRRRDTATLAGILGLLALAFSATGLFAQLQSSLNRIWDVRPKPSEGYAAWIRKRLLGLVMIACLGLLLLGSVAASAAFGMVMGRSGWAWQLVSFAISLAVLVLLFAMILRYLPDVNIEWRNVWAGAALTALLFTAGKYLIGLYLGYSSVGSPYGAAGSLVVLLLWVYYSAAIVFLGAELTQVYAHRSGRNIEPSEHAEWLPEGRSKHRPAA